MNNIQLIVIRKVVAEVCNQRQENDRQKTFTRL